MEEVTKSTTAICKLSDVPVITGPCIAPLREDSSKELLISIIEERRIELSTPVTSKPRICMAPQLLRKDEKNAQYFVPEVVAIGPYHRDKDHLKPAEDHKRTAAAKFTSGRSISEFYNKIKNVAAKAKECYADDAVDKLTDQDFIHMLFFDGCFVLHFINCHVEDDMKEVPMSTHLQGFVVRDMFLLENQLPYVVLEELMSLKSVDLENFFKKIIGKEIEITSPPPTRTRYHLLDLLRTNLLGPDESKWRVQPGPEDLHVFRSVKELREVGIKFHKSKTRHLTDIKFVPCMVWGTLSLPMIVIDDKTRSWFLNMIALEMSPGYENDYGITSFVWFLDCLIDRAKDVRELREEGILLNALGSDEQVAVLFNELATNLAPDIAAYGLVLKQIGEHRKNKINVHFCKFLQTHFSSPWTAIAFAAAVFLLALSVVQTVFAVLPTK